MQRYRFSIARVALPLTFVALPLIGCARDNAGAGRYGLAGVQTLPQSGHATRDQAQHSPSDTAPNSSGITRLPPVDGSAVTAASYSSAPAARAPAANPPAQPPAPTHWWSPLDWLRKLDESGSSRMPPDYHPAPLGPQSG